MKLSKNCAQPENIANNVESRKLEFLRKNEAQNAVGYSDIACFAHVVDRQTGSRGMLRVQNTANNTELQRTPAFGVLVRAQRLDSNAVGVRKVNAKVTVQADAAGCALLLRGCLDFAFSWLRMTRLRPGKGTFDQSARRKASDMMSELPILP